MANGYVVVEADGKWIAALMQQGRADEITQDRAAVDAKHMPRFWACYGNEFGKLQPGVYRFSRTIVDGGERFGFAILKVGKRVNDVAAEVERLAEKGNRGGKARTDKPGIQGYQHMENMSSAAMESRQAGQRRMAEWLEAAARPVDETAVLREKVAKLTRALDLALTVVDAHAAQQIRSLAGV